MPFLDHLEELRWRIFYSVISLVVGTVVGFALVYYFQVLELLIQPVRRAFNSPDLQLIYLSPADPFFVMLKLSLLVGIILAFPVLVYQAWSFLSPALEKREKRAIVPALYLGLVLFIAGVAMAYFAALPVTLEFFRALMVEALRPELEINYTLGFIVKLLLAFGIVFELPVVIMILTAMGLVTPAFLRSKRRHAVVVMTVLASFITPGDVITLTIMMMVPLILLFELSIVLSAAIARRQNVEESEDADDSETSLGPPAGAVEAG
jgi:sec-independent protein translocase protein TatC